MRFRAAEHKSFSLFYCFATLLFCCSVVLLLYSSGYAEVIDRVVAYVDDTAITLSEFRDSYAKTRKNVDNVTEEEVINSMINRLLLIKEAKKMKLEANTEDELLLEYIDIKIKSLILIREDAIIAFYAEHQNKFKGQDFMSVRDDIEKYLFELETNKLLKKHLEELRERSEIHVQLRDK